MSNYKALQPVYRKHFRKTLSMEGLLRYWVTKDTNSQSYISPSKAKKKLFLAYQASWDLATGADFGAIAETNGNENRTGLTGLVAPELSHELFFSNRQQPRRG